MGTLLPHLFSQECRSHSFCPLLLLKLNLIFQILRNSITTTDNCYHSHSFDMKCLSKDSHIQDLVMGLWLSGRWENLQGMDWCPWGPAFDVDTRAQIPSCLSISSWVEGSSPLHHLAAVCGLTHSPKATETEKANREPK